jgi:hypothetical protein
VCWKVLSTDDDGLGVPSPNTRLVYLIVEPAGMVEERSSTMAAAPAVGLSGATVNAGAKPVAALLEAAKPAAVPARRASVSVASAARRPV